MAWPGSCMNQSAHFFFGFWLLSAIENGMCVSVRSRVRGCVTGMGGSS